MGRVYRGRERVGREGMLNFGRKAFQSFHVHTHKQTHTEHPNTEIRFTVKWFALERFFLPVLFARSKWH